MELDASDIINRLSLELANALQQKVIAEAKADALEKKLLEKEEE